MNKIIKNPFNYSGSKNRILPLIQENLPDGCNTIIEPFAGTFEVSLNTNFDYKIYNDKNYYLYSLICLMINKNTNNLLAWLKDTINRYNLSKDNKEAFYDFRNEFNRDWSIYLKSSGIYKETALVYLLALIYHSFNYYLTFDRDGRYINTSGYKRSSFNSSLENKLVEYCKALKKEWILLFNSDFKDFYNHFLQEFICDENSTIFSNTCFWFVDPPYINSDDAYSRTNDLKWTKQDEQDLYDILYDIDKRGGKFMLTNTIECNGKFNDLLHEFSKNFNVINTECEFYNCSYQRKNKKTKEIIVKNY